MPEALPLVQEVHPALPHAEEEEGRLRRPADLVDDVGASEELKDGGLDGGLARRPRLPVQFPHDVPAQVLGRGDGLDGVHGLLEHGLGDDGRIHHDALGGLAPSKHVAAPRLLPQRPRRAVMFPLPIPLWCISIRVTLIPCRKIHTLYYSLEYSGLTIVARVVGHPQRPGPPRFSSSQTCDGRRRKRRDDPSSHTLLSVWGCERSIQQESHAMERQA